MSFKPAEESSCSSDTLLLAVCVCLYYSTVKASSDCKAPVTYSRDTDQRCYVVSINANAKFPRLHLQFPSSPTKLQLAD